MDNYLATNLQYWSGTYNAPNVESFIFRFYGRILKFDYGIDGSGGERLLDFGCGQGAALNFFSKLGFNCFGVDIAENDIAIAKRNMPHISSQLAVCDPKPNPDQLFWGAVLISSFPFRLLIFYPIQILIWLLSAFTIT